MSLAQAIATQKEAILGPGRTEFPLLVKMLFPADYLSVQVHPDDSLAAELGGDVRAKSECWYALSASPDAQVALGLKDGTTDAAISAALGHPALEDLLQYRSVHAGDMMSVPAGTVHAIGPGMVLLEVQQSSDTTYRLWDYGRPRELHLADGLKAIKLVTSAGHVDAVRHAQGAQLISTEHFIVNRVEVKAETPQTIETSGLPQSVVCLDGQASLLSVDDAISFQVNVEQGSAAIIPASVAAYRVAGPCVVACCRVPVS
jgi:mannose-6-phosphate isomerase